MKHKFIRLLPALITIIVAGVVFCCLQKDNTETVIRMDSPEIPEESFEMSQKQTEKELWVYVCGYVKHPGVYRLEAGARIFAE